MKYLLNAVKYAQIFAFKYLKRTFQQSQCNRLPTKSHVIGSMRYGPGMKYLLNTVQQVQHFASKYLKRAFEKNHIKLGLSNMVSLSSIY